MTVQQAMHKFYIIHAFQIVPLTFRCPAGAVAALKLTKTLPIQGHSYNICPATISGHILFTKLHEVTLQQEDALSHRP